MADQIAFSIEELSQILGAKQKRIIYSLIKNRQIVAIKIGREYRILKPDLDHFILTAKKQMEERGGK